MRVTLYVAFVAIAASLAAASAIPTGPTDVQIKELSRTRLDPPFNPPQPRGKNDVGWVYPTGDKVLQAKQDGHCKFNVIMDVSRCAGTSIKQEAVAYPYDDYSMDLLHDHMAFQTGSTNIGPFAQKTISLNKCGFNGRFFLMDQFSDNIFDTSRMSVRLTLEQGKASAWVTAETDEETGINSFLLVTLSVLFASALAVPAPASGVITPRSAANDGIPGNSPKGPGSTSPYEKYPGEIAKWEYPDSKVLKLWPSQPKPSNRDECAIHVQVAVGSCKAGAYGNKPEFIPYDDPSTKAIEGNVRFNVKHEDSDYYDNTTVTLDCYWRGRVMVTDTPELQSRIGLVSVRIDTSPEGSRAWVTAETDEETGMKQDQIAPISFVEFGQHDPNNKNWSPNRGFATSLKTTKKKVDKLLIQVC